MYFTLAEYLTGGYKSEVHETELLHALFYGQYAAMFWYFIFGGMIFPIIILVFVIYDKKLSDRMVKVLIFIASAMINVGMWLKRYLITVPTLARPVFHEGWNDYFPNKVEWWILVGQFAGFIMLFMLLSKMFPIISVWEVEMEEEMH